MERFEVQEMAIAKWFENNMIGTCELGTGVGKTFVGLDVYKRLIAAGTLCITDEILILSSDENLRDKSWKEEMEKWGIGHLWKNVTSECYQTAYRWKNRHYRYVICDEFDFCLSPEYSKFFTHNTYDMLLGLTGYVEEDKRKLQNTIAPTVFKYSTNDAQEAKILNSSYLVGVKFELSKVKDIKVEYTDKKTGDKKSFMTSENAQYAYIEETCDKLLNKIRRLKKKINDSYYSDPQDDMLLESITKQWDIKCIVRAKFLYNSNSCKLAAQNVRDQALSNGTSKALIFSMRKTQAAKISEITYTGDLKKEDKPKVLAKLNSGEINHISLCKALNRGANLVGINVLIFESYTSSKTDFQQRHGRGCRLDPSELLYVYVLIPSYTKKVTSPEGVVGQVTAPTQAYKWATEMVKGYVPKYATSIDINI